jgi:hypothetical protein
VAELLPEERETHLNMMGDNHDVWVVFTDDPYWIRRFDKVATATRTVGEGKEYRLSVKQITLRAGTKKLSNEEKERRAEHMRHIRGNSMNSLSDAVATGTNQQS